MKDYLEQERRRLIRGRRWLIGTGIPLALLALASAVLMSWYATVMAFIGTFVAIRTFDLIVTHEPGIDDGPLNR